MMTIHRMQTTVLPGNRIEVSSPALHVGKSVEVIVVPHEKASQPRDVLEFIRSLPPGPHGFANWDEFEASFQEGRNS